MKVNSARAHTRTESLFEHEDWAQRDKKKNKAWRKVWKCHICLGSVLPSLWAFTSKGLAFKRQCVAEVPWCYFCVCVCDKTFFMDHSCSVLVEQHILTVCMLWMSGLLDLSRYLKEITTRREEKNSFKKSHKYFLPLSKSSKSSLKTASAISQEKEQG